MKDIPIIFSAAMVQALLAGRKTMTRRLAWKTTACFVGDEPVRAGHKLFYTNVGSTPIPMSYPPSPWQKVAIGDRLWVRENFAPRYFDGGKHGYGADWSEASADVVPRPKWTPCIHMPRTASRLTLIVTGKKIEPLQAMSEPDARAEGITEFGKPDTNGRRYFGLPGDDGVHPPTAQRAFQRLWTSLHGADSWSANPEVVALTFRVVKANIDAPEARAA